MSELAKSSPVVALGRARVSCPAKVAASFARAAAALRELNAPRECLCYGSCGEGDQGEFDTAVRELQDVIFTATAASINAAAGTAPVDPMVETVAKTVIEVITRVDGPLYVRGPACQETVDKISQMSAEWVPAPAPLLSGNV